MPNTDDTPAVDPSVEAVKSIAEEFKASLDSMREERASAGVPVPAPATGPSPEETAKRLVAEQAEVTEKYNELCASGEYAQGAQMLLQFQQKVQQATQGDPSDSPAFKAMHSQARREASREHEDLFSKYGDEISAEVDSMPAGDRINPDNWDEAVRRVKARHVDEIVQERLDAAADEAAETAKAKARSQRFGPAPGAPGSRGAVGGTEEVELDEIAQEAAKMLGYSEEEYAELITAAETATIRKGMSRGMVELMKDGGGKVEPGSF